MRQPLWDRCREGAGAEVFLDAFGSGPRCDLQHFSVELSAVHRSAKSQAGRNRPLTRINRRGMASKGREIALTARVHLQHAKAVVGVVEGHALDGAAERFLRRRGMGRWAGIHRSMIVSACRDGSHAV